MAGRRPPENVGNLIENLVFRVLVAGAERWAQSDLTMPQLKVLLLLGESGSARVSWLASEMAVSPPNITGILDRLEKRGWVRRTGDPQDRRVVRIVLTESGQELLRDLCRAGVERLRPATEKIPAELREGFIKGLAAFLEAAATVPPLERADTAPAAPAHSGNNHRVHASTARR
jgi:DNA-binding MarR family transcriptional regulator